MDFDADAPQDAEFRREASAWLKETQTSAGVTTIGRGIRHIPLDHACLAPPAAAHPLRRRLGCHHLAPVQYGDG